MTKSINLTEGSIYKALIKLAMPIIGTSFVQMAYNLTDMIWVGRVGSNAVASVGTAGFFTWLAMAFILIPKVGAEVGVSQSIGRKDIIAAKRYIGHSVQMIIVLAFLYGSVLIIGRKPLIGFFRLGEPIIEGDAINYLVIVSLGMVFYMINPVFTAIFNGYGDSKTPFTINAIGLIINIFLDPLLILGIGPFPRLEVLGAAIATVIAQATVTFIFIKKAKETPKLFSGFELFRKAEVSLIKKIIKLGFPVALQSALFTLIAMVIARIVAKWGPVAIAVQKVGGQIESISWMTAGGFQTAMSAFTGQNYGAKKWDRIYKGYFIGIGIVCVIGIFATFLLIFGAKPVFSVFIQEKKAIELGILYLKILGVSQLFIAIEISTAGAFIGHGKTFPPSFISILFNGLRIPAAYFLSSTSLGLNGVWWAISISSLFKGTILVVWHIYFLNKNPATKGYSIFKI